MNIEKYLVLNEYLLSLFGVSDFRDLQEKLKDAPVGVDSDGRSYFINVLRSSFENLQKNKLPEDILLRYDENIQFHVRRISYKREPVSLKYFQYLAVLFVEVVLDNLKNRKIEFLYRKPNFRGWLILDGAVYTFSKRNGINRCPLGCSRSRCQIAFFAMPLWYQCPPDLSAFWYMQGRGTVSERLCIQERDRYSSLLLAAPSTP